jgi:hypothetical protein
METLACRKACETKGNLLGLKRDRSYTGSALWAFSKRTFQRCCLLDSGFVIINDVFNALQCRIFR